MQEPSRTKGFLCKHCGIACSDMPSLLEHADFCHRSDEDRKFKCDECGRGYRHAGSLANHKKTHDVGSFQCQICSRRLSNALALKSHLRIHTSRKKYSCTECGKAFRLAAQLTTHQKVHRNRVSRGRTRGTDLERNQAWEQLEQEDEPGFNTMPDLSANMGLSVTSENGLERFLGSAAERDVPGDGGDRPFKCDMCDKSYRHNASLINHKKTHQMGIFECPVCFKQLNNLAALSSHQRTHSKTRGRPSMVTPGTPEPYSGSELKQVPDVLQNGATDGLFCQLCQMAFANEDDFQNHIILHNSSSVSFELPASTPEDQHFSYDNSITQSPDSNQYPPSSDTPPLPPLLDKTVDYDQTQGPMENGHIYVPHPIDDDPTTSDTQGEDADQPFQSVNPESSAHAMDDGRHEEAGSSDRRFKCQICGKSYRHAGSLINHKRSHQTGVFQCSICRKSYPHLAALRSHLRIHKGRPTLLATSAEGDWLSSEPLTHESHLGGFSGQDGDDGPALDLPQDLDDSAYLDSDGENQDDLDETEFHEQFDGPFTEGRHQDDPPQDETVTEMHMCADCGETFTDIAGIKSHTCPLLNPYQSDRQEMDFKEDYKRPLDEPGERFVFAGADGSAYFSGRDVDEQALSDGEKAPFKNGEEDDEDDGEMYQCSVCGDHYSSMRALRSHLRGHTRTDRASSSSGPSSPSSLEPERDEEPGRVQQGLIICSTCGESFTQKQDLQAHQLLHADPPEKPPEQYVLQDPSGLRPKEEMESIICGKCGVFFTSVHHLENHTCPEPSEENLDACDVKPDISGALGRQPEHLSGGPGNADRLYRCDQCGRSYRHAGSLLNHKKSHKTGVFRCFICQKRFYNLLALKNHQRTHFDIKKHSCTECGKAFKIHKQLVNHQRVHEENKAKIEELNKQIQTLMEMSGNVSVGGMHPVHASKRRSSRRHRQKDTPQSELPSPEKDGHPADPNDPRPYVCDQCGRSYRHAGSLVNHKNSHKTGEYYCAICNNTYSNQLAMKNHLRTHFSAKKHVCQDCGRSFRVKKQLLNHICRHKRKNASASRAKRKGRRRSKDLTCKDCRLAFPTAELLVGHSCSTFGREPPGLRSTAAGPGRNVGTGAPKIKDERPFRCNVCGRSYRHAGSLLNHKNTHKTGHFSCSYCAKPFSNPMALRNHTRIHTQKKKFVCPTCGKAFRLSSILYNHQKIHARGANANTCQTCGKRFKGKSGLKRHSCYKRAASSSPVGQDAGDKCYTCDQCGRSYRHAGSLLNHKKTHSADLLNCSLCLKTFADPVELQSHLQMARHCCPDCGKTFCEYAHLQSHIEVHSKGLPYYCNACQRNFPNMASFQQHQELHRAVREPSRQGAPVPQGLAWVSETGQQVELPNLPKLHPGFSPVGKSFSEPQDPQENGDAGEKSHVCEHCGRSYRHAGSLLNHKNSHKTGSFYCSVCQKEFTNLMALKNHRRIHVEPKRYQCVECGKAFRVSTQLICHRRIHTKEKPFSCLLCDKRFSSKSNLRHHQKLHQNAQQSFESSFNMDPDGFMDLGVDPFL